MKKVVFVLICSLFVACAQNKKNPLDGHDAPAVPPNNDISRDQMFDECSTRNIVTRPGLTVAEGQSASQDVFLRGVVPSSATLSLSQPVPGLSLKPVGATKDGLKYTLSYAPPKGTIGADKNYAQVDIKIIQNTSIDCSVDISVTTVKSNQVPVISSVSMPKTIDMNSTTVITVNLDVQASDVALTQDLQLDKQFDPTATPTTSLKDIQVYNLTNAIDASAPTVIGLNTYRFTLTIDPQMIKYLLTKQVKAQPKQKEFTMMSQFTVMNKGNNLVSPAKNVSVKIETGSAQ